MNPPNIFVHVHLRKSSPRWLPSRSSWAYRDVVEIALDPEAGQRLIDLADEYDELDLRGTGWKISLWLSDFKTQAMVNEEGEIHTLRLHAYEVAYSGILDPKDFFRSWSMR